MNCFCFMSQNLDCSEKSEVEDGKKGEGNQHLEIRMKDDLDKDHIVGAPEEFSSLIRAKITVFRCASISCFQAVSK